MYVLDISFILWHVQFDYNVINQIRCIYIFLLNKYGWLHNHCSQNVKGIKIMFFLVMNSGR
jgi:hypothetical protein